MENLQENENDKREHYANYSSYYGATTALIFCSIFFLIITIDSTLCDNTIKIIHYIVYFVIFIIGAIYSRIYYKRCDEKKYAKRLLYGGVTLCLVCSYFAFNYFIRFGEVYKENACIIAQGRKFNKFLFKSGGVIEIYDYKLYDKVDVGGIVSITLQKGIFGAPVYVSYDTISLSDSTKIYSMKIDETKSYYDNGLLCEEAGAYYVAHNYYELSWEKGKNGYALWRLGRLYEDGLGVNKNYIYALKLYNQAIENNCSIANKDAQRIRRIIY